MTGELDMRPVWLSLEVASAALALVLIVGIPSAYHMARREFSGKAFLEALITMPLVLPPVVTGFVLLVLVGRNGPVGSLLYAWGIQIVFTPAAAAMAAAVVALPLMYQSAKAAFQAVDVRLEDVARTLGAGEMRIFFRVTLPLAWPGLASGMILAYARALGEFGATMMVAGNIPGRTQTLPTAIYFAAEGNNLAAAGTYVTIISVLTFVLVYGINLWSRRHLAAK